MLTIQYDSREKARAIRKIIKEFDAQGVKHFSSKLYVGDYMNLDNPRLIIDRKQNLTELCSNVTSSHERFRRELVRAKDADIKLIVLVEHGKDVKLLEDVRSWENPRCKKRVKNRNTNKWETVTTKATTGEVLYKILGTMERKYGCKFLFCSKDETGKRIIEILGGDGSDE